MLEKRRAGHADKMDGPNEWKGWYTGVDAIMFQIKNQSDVVVRKVEWHFAEPETAAYFEVYAARFTNIVVIYTPAER